MSFSSLRFSLQLLHSRGTRRQATAAGKLLSTMPRPTASQRSLSCHQTRRGSNLPTSDTTAQDYPLPPGGFAIRRKGDKLIRTQIPGRSFYTPIVVFPHRNLRVSKSNHVHIRTIYCCNKVVTISRHKFLVRNCRG